MDWSIDCICIALESVSTITIHNFPDLEHFHSLTDKNYENEKYFLMCALGPFCFFANYSNVLKTTISSVHMNLMNPWIMMRNLIWFTNTSSILYMYLAKNLYILWPQVRVKLSISTRYMYLENSWWRFCIFRSFLPFIENNIPVFSVTFEDIEWWQ